MLYQNPSQIFKAQNRGHEEDDHYRCLSTFNFGFYFDESRKPFGTIGVLNDETLAPQKTKSHVVKNASEVIIIPLVGTLDLNNENYINTEEIMIFSAEANTIFELRNPYDYELINYLQIQLHPPKTAEKYSIKKDFSFTERNKMFAIHENEITKISIGLFDSKKETFYSLDSNHNGLLAFVINGAFECQNRLLETRDSLALWGIQEIEMESLTENAILLVLETTLQ